MNLTKKIIFGPLLLLIPELPLRNVSAGRCLSFNVRNYSTNNSLVPCSAVKIYLNADLDKLLIIRENTGKSGVYL